jgi:hypothetical protein
MTAVGILVSAVGAGFLYYFFGSYKMPGSRSFELEKEIRDLLYIETHGPVDYARAAERYRFLLSRIHFGDFGFGHSERFTKALKRAEQKSRMIALIDAYTSTGNLEKLREAQALVQSPDYQKLEEYRFTSLWYGGTSIVYGRPPRIILEGIP